MEWIILLVFSLILLGWRINEEMSSIQPPTNPFTSKKQEDQSSFSEDDENTAFMDDSFSSSSGTDFGLSHFDDKNSYSDIYTDPSYCHLPGNIYYHICHDDSSSSYNDWSSWDSGSSNWDS
ncbi:hypothetical protein [Thermocrinis sp.]|uniref:hypothetical protein n=1 Tax=Thermocrinis sp. TaxID=2024383 RepID=UPI002FDE48F8